MAYYCDLCASVATLSCACKCNPAYVAAAPPGPAQQLEGLGVAEGRALARLAVRWFMQVAVVPRLRRPCKLVPFGTPETANVTALRQDKNRVQRSCARALPGAAAKLCSWLGQRSTSAGGLDSCCRRFEPGAWAHGRKLVVSLCAKGSLHQGCLIAWGCACVFCTCVLSQT